MYVKGLLGFGILVRFEGVKCLAVGEEATTNCWSVMGGLAVTI